MRNDTGEIELFNTAPGEVSGRDPQFYAWILRFVAVCKKFFDGNEARLNALEARVKALEDAH